MSKMQEKTGASGQGEGQVFVCSCGHREKLSAFNERKKNQKPRVSKKDVSRYMSEQKKQDDNINTELADALSKLKFK